MTKDDIRHPAFRAFMAYADSDVLLTSPLEDAWETYKEGYEAALKHVIQDAEKGADVLEFPQAEEDDSERIDRNTAAGIYTEKPPSVVPPPIKLPFTCARCPDPKNPTPEFHTTGVAHTPPKKNSAPKGEIGAMYVRLFRAAKHEPPCDMFHDQMGCSCARCELAKFKQAHNLTSLAEFDRVVGPLLPCSICRDPDCENPGGKH